MPPPPRPATLWRRRVGARALGALPHRCPRMPVDAYLARPSDCWHDSDGARGPLLGACFDGRRSRAPVIASPRSALAAAAADIAAAQLGSASMKLGTLSGPRLSTAIDAYAALKAADPARAAEAAAGWNGPRTTHGEAAQPVQLRRGACAPDGCPRAAAGPSLELVAGPMQRGTGTPSPRWPRRATRAAWTLLPSSAKLSGLPLRARQRPTRSARHCGAPGTRGSTSAARESAPARRDSIWMRSGAQVELAERWSGSRERGAGHAFRGGPPSASAMPE
jgi:hypothetical protein